MPKRISPPSMRVFSAPRRRCGRVCAGGAGIVCVADSDDLGGERWLPRLAELPHPLQEMAYHSVNRLIDYQDEAYAEQWLARLLALIDRDEDRSDYSLSHEAGRHLALWMAYEDIPRVAQLKVRPDREDQIRSEVKADSDQPMTVAEFFHPRVEEVLPYCHDGWVRHC
ncbi:MAG: hypothetical protein CM15mP125_1140 [Gammaproteobacteria bacterium]|nr:MAG: hypothetical protein CM15mP125_1140 [Gammaproteobacteria bacterium]